VRRRRFRLFWRLVRRRIFVILILVLVFIFIFIVIVILEFLVRQSVPELQYKPACGGFHRHD
jgi:ABC-type phosphate transport system permease subunit